MANGDANAIPIFIVRVRVDRLSAFWALALLPPLQTAVPVAASSCSPGGGGGDRRTGVAFFPGQSVGPDTMCGPLSPSAHG